MPINQHRLEFAATVFIRECIRQYLKAHPKTQLSDMPIKALCEYSPRDQKALMVALEKAFEATDGLNDAYRVFIQNKLDMARDREAQPQTTT